MKNINLGLLINDWREAKDTETAAQERRREIEDAIVKELNVPADLDSVASVEIDDGVTLKITGRLDRKVNGDKVQELAAEHGLSDHLQSLFRWKPEINLVAWRAADEKITKPLAGAITTKPGRPSFAVVTKKKED